MSIILRHFPIGLLRGFAAGALRAPVIGPCFVSRRPSSLVVPRLLGWRFLSEIQGPGACGTTSASTPHAMYPRRTTAAGALARVAFMPVLRHARHQVGSSCAHAICPGLAAVRDVTLGTVLDARVAVLLRGIFV